MNSLTGLSCTCIDHLYNRLTFLTETLLNLDFFNVSFVDFIFSNLKSNFF